VCRLLRLLRPVPELVLVLVGHAVGSAAMPGCSAGARPQTLSLLPTRMLLVVVLMLVRAVMVSRRR
jgi:hypothetical protein